VLSSYQSKYKVQPIDSLLVTSAIPAIDHIVDNMKESLSNINIEIFDALSKVTLPENLKEKASAEPNSSVFSSVLGLATRKLDVFGYYEYVTGTNNINLLPDREGVRNQEKIKFLSRWGVVIFITLSIIVATWHFVSDEIDIQDGEKQVAEYNLLKKQKNEKLATLNKLNKKIKKLAGMLEASKNINSNQGFMYEVLTSINNSVPSGVSLNSIDYSTNTIEITGLSVDDNNIITFIENLAEKPTIDKASLLTMAVKIEGQHTFKEFSIRCVLAKQKTLDEKESFNGN